MGLNSVEELIEDIRQGKMVILMDDEDRENEGDLIMAAECVKAEHINFMARFARGLICMPMTHERCERLNIPLMVDRNNSGFGTKFTVSIEAAEGVTTGISAADRARTVQAACAKNAVAKDIVTPGHIFPLMAQPGGVLSRAGHTEAACDLSKLAGFESTAAIVEIMNEDGTMARRSDLEQFAQEHQIKIGTIADLIHYRALNEQTVERTDENDILTEYGTFKMVTFKDTVQGNLHLALVAGQPGPDRPALVRVHQADTLRDLLGAVKVGSKSWPIGKALSYIAEHGEGVVVLLDTNSAEKDMSRRIKSFFKDTAQRTAEVTGSGAYQTIGTGSQILRELGVGKMRLMSTPMKFSAISGFELEIVEYLPYNNESV